MIVCPSSFVNLNFLKLPGSLSFGSVHSHDSRGMDFEIVLIDISKLKKELKTLNRLSWEDSTALYSSELN